MNIFHWGTKESVFLSEARNKDGSPRNKTTIQRLPAMQSWHKTQTHSKHTISPTGLHFFSAYVPSTTVCALHSTGTNMQLQKEIQTRIPAPARTTWKLCHSLLCAHKNGGVIATFHAMCVCALLHLSSGLRNSACSHSGESSLSISFDASSILSWVSTSIRGALINKKLSLVVLSTKTHFFGSKKCISVKVEHWGAMSNRLDLK